MELRFGGLARYVSVCLYVFSSVGTAGGLFQFQ